MCAPSLAWGFGTWAFWDAGSFGYCVGLVWFLLGFEVLGGSIDQIRLVVKQIIYIYI